MCRIPIFVRSEAKPLAVTPLFRRCSMGKRNHHFSITTDIADIFWRAFVFTAETISRMDIFIGNFFQSDLMLPVVTEIIYVRELIVHFAENSAEFYSTRARTSTRLNSSHSCASPLPSSPCKTN